MTASNRTTAYTFTFAANDAQGLERLARMRETMKLHNRTSAKKLRICVVGRLSKDSEFRHLYPSDGYRQGNQHHIKAEHSSHFDVYVQNRY